MTEQTLFPLLGDVAKLRTATNGEVVVQISNCLAAGRVPQYPPISLAALHALMERLCAPNPTHHLQEQQGQGQTSSSADPTVYFDSQQVRMLVSTFLSAAAKAEGFMIQSWFAFDPQQQQQTPEAVINSIVAMLLHALEEEAHSMAVGEAFRLLLQNSPQVLQAFVAYRAPFPAPETLPSGSVPSSQQQQSYQQQLQLHQQSFAATAFGVVAPLLTDSSALRNHAAWQVLMAALQPDPSRSIQPPREVVELLSRHVHAYLEVVVLCLRHANPACRRFALRVLSDTLQAIRAWNPIANCLLQSPAVFFAILANAEGPPIPEHWPCYQILKMFISLPSKCPLMRHLIYINRDALAEYVQIAAMRYGLNVEGETKFLLSKLDTMTPLTAEEAALIHCSI